MALPFQDSILLLGDSLTQRMDSPGNLHQRFAEAYQRKLDIQNRAFGGYNSAWVEPLLPYILAKKGQSTNTPCIRLVTIWLDKSLPKTMKHCRPILTTGTNDSVTEGRMQYISLSDFTKNMHKIISAFTSPDSPYAVADTPVSIVLITPSAPYFPQMPDDRKPGRSTARTKGFAEEVKRLFAEYKAKEGEQKLKEGEFGWKIALLDFWTIMDKAAGGEEQGLEPYYFDGVHYTTKGYTLLWDHLSALIKTEFKGRGLDYDDFDGLPRRIPLFSEIDPSRPESVVERMALPKIRGGSGPAAVEQKGYEG